MNTTPAAAGPGFLAALLPLTRYDNSFEVTISADHFSLTVEVCACGHAPLKATGTPAALERALPAAIAKYAQWVEAQESADDGDVKIELPGEKAPARAAAPREAAAPKRARKKVAAKKKPTPRAKVAKRRAPAVKKPTVKSQASRPGKPECIADYKALKAKHGDKLTRRLFVDNAKTGRRYEKLWANNWPAFVKEAEGSKAAPASSAPAPVKTTASKPKKDAKKTGKPKADKKPGPWIVKHKGGKQLGATILEKKVGDAYNCSAGEFTVESINAEKREILVVPKNTGIALPGESTPPPASDPKPAPASPATQTATEAA